METLVQRLVQNPHDQDAITYAHHAGQNDPRAYAMLLEKVGTATSDPAFASHWLTEAANVWSTTLGDAHRAARALMIAIDRDPTQPTPAERLADLYRDKGDTKALVALLERRAKALAPLAQHDTEMRSHVAGLHEELGRLWSEPPLTQPRKATENYRRAIEYDARSAYAIYALRELLKSQSSWAEAIPYFQMEQALVDDPERQLALYVDEAEVRKNAGDSPGSADALRQARSVEGGRDPSLKQQLATIVLERVQAGENVHESERAESAQLFVELAEEFPGEHGYSYATCALEVLASHDRAMQLALYYAEQLGRTPEVAPRAAGYLKANPQGAHAAEARQVVSGAMDATGDVSDEMLDALAPAASAPSPERVRGLLEMAEALARKGKKNEAATKYREVLDLDGANEEAVGFLEGHLRQTRKYQELRDMLLGAARTPGVDAESKKGWLREIAGLCETQLRDLDTAINAWKQLVSLDRSEDGPKNQLRRLLERAQRWDDLATLLEQEAEQTADVEARISMEKSLAKLHEQKRKDPAAAGEAWARIARLTPEDEAAVTTAVKLFERGARLDLAAQVIDENAPNIADERARAQLLKKLGELREAAGETLPAGEAFADAAALGQDAGCWEAAERCFVAAMVWDQAANAIDQRAQLEGKPKDKAALFAKEAEYLVQAGDEAAAAVRLEQATDLDPPDERYARALEELYNAGDRNQDLAAFLLRRAEKLNDKPLRVSLRKRAASLQRDMLADPDAARASLIALLVDSEDAESLALLADDSEQRGEFAEAVDYLHRLAKISDDPRQKSEIMLREAHMVASGLDDAEGAIERFEQLLKQLDPSNLEALSAIAELHEKRGDPKGQADALERQLAVVADPQEKLAIAQQLAQLYEGPLDDANAAVRVLDVVRGIDPEDFDALGRVCVLCERLENWQRVAEHTAQLIEVEGDDQEISRMTRRLSEILHEKLERGDEALAALMDVADSGDEPCREAYIKLGDELGWKGIVATKLVEWYLEARVGPARNDALRGAFDRFLEVGRDAEACQVAQELARTKSAGGELATQLEEIAVKIKNLDALAVAHDLLVAPLSGPSRAEELVRQAEVLVAAGVDPQEAAQHGEQALSSVPNSEVEPLLERLSRLAVGAEQVIDLYERQIMRCKAPADRLTALARAAQIAAEHGQLERARGFFDLALSGNPAQEETLSALEGIARATDQPRSEPMLIPVLAEALANGGQGARDGGRTRSALLRRAANLAFHDLRDTDRAFRWLGDALVTHVSDESLDALEQLANEVGEPSRAEAVLGRALEEVFDGPLVRKLLARRASLRREQLGDHKGAAVDLKRLHDLSPSDTSVMEQLSQLYTQLEDWRGMVQLYEDQILRGKDPAGRAELARKVARLWEEKLDDFREAADAWRRVLRMKSGDPEATEGLERAKAGMIGRPQRSVPPPPPEDEPEPMPAHEESTDAYQRAETEAQEATQPQPEQLAAEEPPEDEDKPTIPPEAGPAGAVRPDINFPKADDVTLSAPLEDFEEGFARPPTSYPPPPPHRSSIPPPPPARSAPPPAWDAPPPPAWGAPPPASYADEVVPVDDDELLVDDDELVDDEPPAR
jgi:cellulose synthase operon protein C